MADLVYSLGFADGLEAAEFVSRLREHAEAVAGAGTPSRQVVVWIRDPVVREPAGTVCCVYLTPAALEAARAAGLSTEEAEPITMDELPAARIAVIGDPGPRPASPVEQKQTSPPPG